jgi:hypothetical protein
MTSSAKKQGRPREPWPSPQSARLQANRISGTHTHRALRLQPPDGRDPTPLNATDRLRRRDLLGGLIHEYEAA